MTRLTLTPTGLRMGSRLYPCSVGRGGVTVTKREGDGGTPTGRLRITAMLYRPDRLPRPTDWATPIVPRDLWCDDPSSPAYNSKVTAPFAPSHEHLRRADPLYDLILITDWNMDPALPGLGSAIFVHQWRRPGFPTAGCIALSRRDLWRIATCLRPGAVLDIPATLAGRGRAVAADHRYA